jgi:hypothetical protein
LNQDSLRLDADDRRRERAAVAGLLSAFREENVPALPKALSEVEATYAWRQALRACARLQEAPEGIRKAFLPIWLDFGDTLRSHVADDLTLIRALRVLLPAYEGDPVTLFRGESLGNRTRRTYGLSWSSDRHVAAAFARNSADRYEGGTVVLEGVAPPEAIISAPGLLLPEKSVDEYVVDRRRLSKVSVLERFPNSVRNRRA